MLAGVRRWALRFSCWWKSVAPEETRLAQGEGARGFFGDDRLQQKGGRGCPGQLRKPIEEGLDRANALGDPNAHGHGGVKKSAGDVAGRGKHDGGGETASEGDAEGTGAPPPPLPTLIWAKTTPTAKKQPVISPRVP